MRTDHRCLACIERTRAQFRIGALQFLARYICMALFISKGSRIFEQKTVCHSRIYSVRNNALVGGRLPHDSTGQQVRSLRTSDNRHSGMLRPVCMRCGSEA